MLLQKLLMLKSNLLGFCKGRKGSYSDSLKSMLNKLIPQESDLIRQIEDSKFLGSKKGYKCKKP